MASKDQGPPSWNEALSQAASIIAAGMANPDADIKFGLAMIGAMTSHQQKPGGAGAGASGGGPAAGGDAGSPPGGGPGGPPPGMGGAPGPAGGGAPNSAMPSMAAPGGPVPGGMTPGLSPNPDELRRVLSDVAGK